MTSCTKCLIAIRRIATKGRPLRISGIIAVRMNLFTLNTEIAFGALQRLGRCLELTGCDPTLN